MSKTKWQTAVDEHLALIREYYPEDILSGEAARQMAEQEAKLRKDEPMPLAPDPWEDPT